MLGVLSYGAIGLCAKARPPREKLAKDELLVDRRGTLSKRDNGTTNLTAFCDRMTIAADFLCRLLAAFASSHGCQATRTVLRLGYGRRFTNDAIAEFRGSRGGPGFLRVLARRCLGPEWTVSLARPAFGQLIELRLGVELLRPRRALRRPRPGSPPYGRCVSAGVHTHFERDSVEIFGRAAI